MSMNPISRARKMLLLFGKKTIQWLLNADFSDTQAAPIPRTAEPGPGALTVVDVESKFSISAGKLNFTNPSTVAWDRLTLVGAGIANASGLVFLTNINFTAVAYSWVGWNNDSSPADSIITGVHGFRSDSPAGAIGVVINGANFYPQSTIPYATSTPYTLAVMRRDNGAVYFIKGGVFSNWTLFFISSFGNATGYPALNNYSSVAAVDYLRVRQLPAPFSSDYGLATLHQVSPVNGTEYEGEADGIFDFTFTLPNPLEAKIAGVRFRYQDANNYWLAYSLSGFFYLTSVVGGTITDRITVGGVFTAGQTYTIRVISQGSKHNCYTLNGTTWTKRGAEVDVTTAFDAEKTMMAFTDYVTPPTLSALDAWPRTLSAARAAELDLVDGVTWLLRDDFTTAAAAGQIVRRPAVPGPGTLTYVQNDGNMSNAAGKLTFPAQTTFAWTDLGVFYAAGVARSAGQALIAALTFSTIAASNGALIGFNSAANLAVSGDQHLFQIDNFGDRGFVYFNGTTTLTINASALATGTAYQFAIVLRTSGAYLFIKGGSFTSWTLVWATSEFSFATAYSVFQNGTHVGALDSFRTRQLPAPFNSDYGLATLTTTTFTQSLGAELLTNGDFSAWTGDNPDGWVLVGESGSDPMVTQVASGGGAGTGAARLYSSATPQRPYIGQTVLTIGAIYELSVIISALTGLTSLGVQDAAGGFFYTAVVGTLSSVVRAAHAFFYVGNREAPSDITVDSISIKPITINTAQTATADGIFDFEFTVPASPLTGQRIHLLYRIEAAGDEFVDCWNAYLERAASDWTFKLDSISAGTRTNRISVTGITGSPDTIRVICEGSLHDCYTKTGTTWTKRGSQVNVSHLNTAVLINTVYSSAATPGRLTAWPRTLSAGLGAELEKV